MFASPKSARGTCTQHSPPSLLLPVGSNTRVLLLSSFLYNDRSYGKVSLFRNFHDGRYYAIKVLNRELLQRKRVGPGVTALEDVMREERILKRLHNDNIVRIVETINDPGSPKMYIIMDYLAGT